MSNGRNDHAWRKIRRRVLAEEDHCWLCNRIVDKSLSGRLKWGPTVDHLDGDHYNNHRSNLHLAHNWCNSKRNSPTIAEARMVIAGGTPTSPLNAGRQW